MKTGKDLIAGVNAYTPSEGELAFWWLGQHGFALKMGAAVCYVDAFLSPLGSRTVAPLLSGGDVTNADIVMGSHDHGDHIDRGVWPAIAEASPKARFVTPKLLCEKVADELEIPRERVVGIDEGVTLQLGDVKVSGVPASHEFLDVDEKTGLHPYVGFVIEAGGMCVYHAGDTCLYEGMQALLRNWKIDLAFLPINGRDARRLSTGCIGNMTYQEAADLAGSIGARVTVPAHYEMFKANSQDPQPFVDFMKVKYPKLETILPEHGERVLVRAGN